MCVCVEERERERRETNVVFLAQSTTREREGVGERGRDIYRQTDYTERELTTFYKRNGFVIDWLKYRFVRFDHTPMWISTS